MSTSALLLLLATFGSAPDALEGPCPWCEDKPERLSAVGAISHGPFPIATITSDELARNLPGNEWVFLETAHLRLASNLGSLTLDTKARKELEPDLERLRQVFPDMKKSLRRLDPWLRLHLFALRAEDFYARFQRVLGVTDEDFPEARLPNKPYMGDGRYLGEKEKFELVFHSRRQTHLMLTRDVIGVQVTDALRWHFGSPHKLFASVPAEDADLQDDEWLFPHSVHLMSHLFLCAYKHFSYDPPIWLDEGLAHVLEREVNALSTTIDGDEGTGPHRGGHQDWKDSDADLVRKGDQARIGQLMSKRVFSDLSQEEHVTAWSMVRFLLEKHPEGFARFVGGVKGQLDERGYPTGENLLDLQRKLFEEIWGWTPAQFDEAWKAWVTTRE